MQYVAYFNTSHLILAQIPPFPLLWGFLSAQQPVRAAPDASLV
jgi:hypothetical protein